MQRLSIGPVAPPLSPNAWTPSGVSYGPDFSSDSRPERQPARMVGATGIEPATPQCESRGYWLKSIFDQGFRRNLQHYVGQYVPVAVARAAHSKVVQRRIGFEMPVGVVID
jgi:hypothetical protein